MSEIRRGSAAIQEAAESSGRGGSFRPYLPSIYWKDDKEEHYVLFLTDIDQIPLFDMIQFIKDENGYMQEAVAKTDQFFGERSDDFVKLWDAKARKTNVAIAVELEAVYEVVNKRRKPRGFEVKTVEYERRIYDDDGEDTGETEEVVAPAVGYIAQSPNNFFNVVANYDANEAPITETALKITRIGKDKSTSYTVVGYDEQPIDLSNLTDYVDGISYLGDEAEKVINEIEKLSDDEAALHIGTVLLDKRIEELIDPERYDELLAGVDESMDIYGKGKSKGKGKAKAERPSKGSQRRGRRVDTETDDEPNEDPSDPEPTEEVKPARKAKAAKKAAAKSTPQERMAELRKRAAAKAA